MQCTRIIHCSSQLKFERGFMYFLQLTSYGGSLRYTVKYETDRTVPYQRHMYGVDVIIQVRLLKDANTHTCKIHTCKTQYAVPYLYPCSFSIEW